MIWPYYDLTMAMFGHLFFGRYSNRKETLAKGTSKDQDFDDMRVWPLFSGQVPTVFVSLFLGVSQLRPYDPLKMGRRSPQVNKWSYLQRIWWLNMTASWKWKFAAAAQPRCHTEILPHRWGAPNGEQMFLRQIGWRYGFRVTQAPNVMPDMLWKSHEKRWWKCEHPTSRTYQYVQ